MIFLWSRFRSSNPLHPLSSLPEDLHRIQEEIERPDRGKEGRQAPRGSGQGARLASVHLQRRQHHGVDRHTLACHLPDKGAWVGVAQSSPEMFSTMPTSCVHEYIHPGHPGFDPSVLILNWFDSAILYSLRQSRWTALFSS